MIKLICKVCGNEEQTNIFYDKGREGIWCSACGELDQICHREYDWKENTCNICGEIIDGGDDARDCCDDCLEETE